MAVDKEVLNDEITATRIPGGDFIDIDYSDIDLPDDGRASVPALEGVANMGWTCPVCHYGISPTVAICPCHD